MTDRARPKRRRPLVRRLLVWIWAVGLLWAPGAAPAASPRPAARLMAEAEACRKTLYADRGRKAYRHNWLRCLARYETIPARYPGSEEAPLALYRAARMSTHLYRYSGKREDLQKALDLYGRVVGKYPQSRLADDAQFRIGEIHLRYRHDPAGAYEAFKAVSRRFPRGDMRPRAEKAAARLKGKVRKSRTPAKARAPSRPAREEEEAALAFGRAETCRKALYRSAEKRRYRNQWLTCLRAYERVYERFPASDQAAWALYHAARGYRGLYRISRRPADLEQALGLFERLAEAYPRHRLADDAQFAIGEIVYKEKKNLAQAYVEFLKVHIKWPNGDMHTRAKQRLEELSAVLSADTAAQDGAAASGSAARPAAVKGIRHWSTPNYTRVVIDLERPVTYEHHLLPEDKDHHKPRRIYLDLKAARVSADMESRIPIKDGLLQRARAGQFRADTVRVVLDIESITGYKVFPLHDPFRIVVDVHRAEDADAPARARAVRKGVHKSSQPPKDVSLAKQLGLSVKRIVLDPGHGGKDPGCFLPGGIKEKDLVLDLAKILAKKIRREIGCEVSLTRSKDVFLSLEQRTAIANMRKADLFISLHINAHRSRKVWGLETYFLNMATDEEAVMVAARENATSQKNISDLQAILNDLILNTKIHESSRLAHEVQKGMVNHIKERYKRVRSLGVKQAPFYVLIGAQMPAILVETGFLTNATEKRRLLSKSYRRRMAEGITAGIRSYIEGIEAVYMGG